VARVEIPDDMIASLKTALAALDEEGCQLMVEEAAEQAPASGMLLNLDLVGPDHPGILREISHCLAQHGVSVEEMETDIQGAPMGGGNLFYARARVRAPARLGEEQLRHALEALAGSLMVDITLREDS
jgi:glycine cleavage system regulatory protein